MSDNVRRYDLALTERSKILGVAALFEDEFSLDWVEELTCARASAVLSALDEAVEKGWLWRKRPAVYCFADEACRKELADMMTPEASWHRAAAGILIRELPDEDRSVLQVSAHLLRAPVDWEGCQWLVRAGRIFVEASSAQKAIASFSHVLRGLSERSGDAEDRLFIETAMEHSNVFAGRSAIDGSVAFLLEAQKRAKRLQDQGYEILLEMHLAKYERLSADFNRALRRFERAYAKAQALGDKDLLAAATVFHTYFLFWQGRFKDVIEVYEKSHPEVDRYPVGRFSSIAAVIVGHCYGMTGQANLGLGLLDTIRRYCLERGDLYMASHATAAIAMVMLSIGRADEAARYLRKGLKEAETSNNRWARSIVSLILALVCHLAQDRKGASHYLRSFHKQGRVIGVDSVLFPYLLEVYWAMGPSTLMRLPGTSLAHEIAHALKQRNVYLKGLALRYEALKGAREGRPPREMVQLLTRSADHLRTSGNRTELGKTCIELARLYLSAGDGRKGKSMARAASDILWPINPALIPDDLKAPVGYEYREASVLDAIFDARHYLGATEKGTKVFQWVVATANRLVGAERAALLVNGGTEGSALHVRASKNLAEKEVLGPGFAYSRTVITEVMASGKGRIFQLPHDKEAPSPGALAGLCICVPIVLQGRTIGALYHENRLLGNVFKQRHLDLLAFFASIAALNLEREMTPALDQNRSASDRDMRPSDVQAHSEELPPDGIVGSSLLMKRVLKEVHEIARTDATVMILGETGVGKNLIAGAIHRQSERREGPFLVVQCSALTESLITSELFGHEKGAFTGATDRRLGRFELADGGTLFLDEIGDLSLEVQARLLRVLQTKEFERVGGGKKTLTSDFRLITATNRDLAEEVRQRRFREDLYYRINVVPLHIPPLRERKEDIPLLARHFLAVHSAKQRSGPKGLTPQGIIDLMAYDWPGNVRELENVIQRALLTGRGSHLQLSHLERKTGVGDVREAGFKRLDQVEREYILQTLDARRWRIRGPGGAAEVLGINPSTLRSRMKKLGIARSTEASGD